jgi:hypothetical protein
VSFLRDRLQIGPAAEDGLTIVEVVVAGMLLIIGGLGVFGMVDTATRNTFRAEQSQVVGNVLQREMEKIRALPYDDIGLTGLPVNQSGENNPNSRISGTSFYTRRAGTGLRPMISGGSVAPGPEPFSVEDVTGTIYRYIVWDACPGSTCSDGNYLKRAIVVVKLDSTASGGSNRRYQEIQSQIVDPDAEPAEGPGVTPGGDNAVWWPLWLTDSTCDLVEPQTPGERGAIGDHLSHNTRGECSQGAKTGNDPGAPDLLWPEAPILSDESPVYDYSSDVEPVVEPDHDKGLQLMRGADCAAMPVTAIAGSPDSDTTMFQKVHKWVTPPVDTKGLALTGDATMSLRTQTIEHGVYGATICAWLFVRSGGKDTVLTQALGSSAYATYSASPWPSTGWDEIKISLNLATSGGAISLPEGSRLGFALSVDDGSGSGLQMLYDEPTFDSRISLATTGTLPTWP